MSHFTWQEYLIGTGRFLLIALTLTFVAGVIARFVIGLDEDDVRAREKHPGQGFPQHPEPPKDDTRWFERSVPNPSE